MGGWFRFQGELDSARCESSHCTESQTHPDLSEPDQSMLCFPIPPSLGKACTPSSLSRGSFYHMLGVLGRGQGVCEGGRETQALADPFPPSRASSHSAQQSNHQHPHPTPGWS